MPPPAARLSPPLRSEVAYPPYPPPLPLPADPPRRDDGRPPCPARPHYDACAPLTPACDGASAVGSAPTPHVAGLTAQIDHLIRARDDEIARLRAG
eukprot:gene23152-65949_t